MSTGEMRMNTETIEQVAPVQATPVNPFQPVFDALVKAVADQIMKQVLESVELESKISLTMDLLLEDKLDVDGEVEHWFRNNFDIWDYSDNIEEMLDEDKVKSIVRDMTFSAD
jgi:hypothetical protein